MATKKKMLQAAAGAAGGGEALAIEDVFSTYLYTGNGSSQVIENGINLGQSFGSGSVEFDGVTDSLRISDDPAFNLGSDDYTFEFWVYPRSFASQQIPFAWQWDNSGGTRLIVFVQNTNATYNFYYLDGSYNLISTATVNLNEWNHITLVRSGQNVYIGVNGVLQTANTTFSETYPDSNLDLNIGSSLLSGAPTAYYNGYISNLRVIKGTALYTSNFTPPTSQLTAISGTVLLTCQGSDPFVDNSTNAFTITQNGNPQAATFGPFDAAEPGEGGLVWLKDRVNSNGHVLYDTERGAYPSAGFLVTNDGIAESTTLAEQYAQLTSFNSNGFTVGPATITNVINGSGGTYASWTFRKAPRFFDVVTYTGDGTTGRAISHNLGVAPGCMIVKYTSGSTSFPDWWVYHRGFATPETSRIMLNATDAVTTGTGSWGNTNPTNSVFYVGAASGVITNESGVTYVAYLFAHDPLGPSGDGSDGLIACGSFTTDGSGNFSEVNLGWEPQWLLIKRSDSATGGSWLIMDNMRGLGVTNTAFLYPNLTNAEAINTVGFVHLTPTGFKGASPTQQQTSATYIYIAIRRGPMRAPTSGTEVFAPVTRDSSVGGVNYYTGFPVDLSIFNARTGPGNYFHARLTASGRLQSVNTAAEIAADAVDFTSNVGYQPGTSSTTTNALTWNFRRAPGFFDVVAYTGDGVAGRQVAHNLGVVPELVITKTRSVAASWWTRAGLISQNQILRVDNGGGFLEFAMDADTSTTFNCSLNNTSGATHIAYLFATLAGVSKVGSYTGNGSSQTIDCGFTTGARFILIKRTDSTGDWYVWDTARGIVAGNDPHLSLNTTAAEVTTDDSIDPDSSGFIVNQVSATNINVSSATYIYLAIA